MVLLGRCLDLINFFEISNQNLDFDVSWRAAVAGKFVILSNDGEL
jgi:hypothetical protein